MIIVITITVTDSVSLCVCFALRYEAGTWQGVGDGPRGL